MWHTKKTILGEAIEKNFVNNLNAETLKLIKLEDCKSALKNATQFLLGLDVASSLLPLSWQLEFDKITEERSIHKSAGELNQLQQRVCLEVFSKFGSGLIYLIENNYLPENTFELWGYYTKITEDFDPTQVLVTEGLLSGW